VGVTVEAALGVTVGGLVAGQVPDDERLVTATGEQHVGACPSVSLIVSHSDTLLRRTSPAKSPSW